MSIASLKGTKAFSCLLHSQTGTKKIPFRRGIIIIAHLLGKGQVFFVKFPNFLTEGAMGEKKLHRRVGKAPYTGLWNDIFLFFQRELCYTNRVMVGNFEAAARPALHGYGSIKEVKCKVHDRNNELQKWGIVLQPNELQQEEYLWGRNTVLEGLKAGREMEHILVIRGERLGSATRILAMAREKGIPVKEVDSRKLDQLTGNAPHQGVAAKVSAHRYSEVEDILALAAARSQQPFVVVCDELEDPHNLGAIIRTAECAGAHGVIIPKRRSVGMTSVVAKTSAGALEHLPVARVTNLAMTLDSLKEKGLWVYGADMEGTDYRGVDYSGGVALVIGSEGKGISRLIREKCDFLLSIPLRGQIASLNASVAAGILIYQIAQSKF